MMPVREETIADGDRKLRMRSDLRVYELDGELLVTDSVSGGTHHLNGTARFIWERCDGICDEARIAEQVTEVFDVSSAEALEHVSATLQRLQVLGMVE